MICLWKLVTVIETQSDNIKSTKSPSHYRAIFILYLQFIFLSHTMCDGILSKRKKLLE